MSIVDDLLVILSGYNAGYKLMRKRMHGYTGPANFGVIKRSLPAKENTLSITLYRLKKEGLVRNDDRVWHVTQKGVDYLKARMKKYPHSARPNPSIHKREKSVIIAFDIPEIHRKKRDWLRAELIALGFTQLQKSLWFGPAPLSKDFVSTLAEVGILEYMKFFQAKE